MKRKYVVVLSLGISSLLLSGCGSETTDSHIKAELSFTQDIDPILKSKCSQCHNTLFGSPLPQFVGNEPIFLQNKEKIIKVLTTPNPLLRMPPLMSLGGQLTEEEKQKILQLLDQV